MEDGYYSFGITAAESNGDSIVITPVSSTANVNVIGVPGAVYTTNDIGLAGASLTNIDLPNQTMDITGTITTATNLTTNNDKTGYTLSATGVDAIFDELLAGHSTADSVGLVLNDLQDAGRLDALIDAIKAKTDDLTFTKALELDVNQQSVNGVTITGDGSGTKFGV